MTVLSAAYGTSVGEVRRARTHHDPNTVPTIFDEVRAGTGVERVA